MRSWCIGLSWSMVDWSLNIQRKLLCDVTTFADVTGWTIHHVKRVWLSAGWERPTCNSMRVCQNLLILYCFPKPMVTAQPTSVLSIQFPKHHIVVDCIRWMSTATTSLSLLPSWSLQRLNNFMQCNKKFQVQPSCLTENVLYVCRGGSIGRVGGWIPQQFRLHQINLKCYRKLSVNK